MLLRQTNPTSSGASAIKLTVPDETPNGVLVAFTTPDEYIAGSLLAFVSGSLQEVTELTSTTFQLDFAPLVGELIQVAYVPS